MSWRIPRTTLDGMRTPGGFAEFLKLASVCIPMAGLLSPLSPVAAETIAVDAAVDANDSCGGPCSGVLPSNRNGRATLSQILLGQTFQTFCRFCWFCCVCRFFRAGR
jgi:hypothetical protein